MTEIIHTNRLSLRELNPEDDINFMTGLLADPEVMLYWPNPMDRSEAIQWIEKQLKRYTEFGCGYWLRGLAESTERCPECGKARDDMPPEPEGPG